MLQQVFMNLIGNAVKHAGRAGGVVMVGWAREGDGFSFTVADDGPGIAPAFQDRIWGIFQTLAPRATRPRLAPAWDGSSSRSRAASNPVSTGWS
jgi:signal transduction histidine kinase